MLLVLLTDDSTLDGISPMTMEFTVEELPDLLKGPLNDEDLYAICEKLCSAVLTLDQNTCRKIMVTRESVLLGPEGQVRIEIG